MLRIVVADDEFYARKALIRKISMADPDAVIAADFENGQQAADYIREHRDEVDLLFTDVRMPEMDGLELSRCVAEEELGVEIIIVSGFSEFEYAKKAMTFGVNNYLIKPVKAEELKEALDRVKEKTQKYEARVRTQMTRRTGLQKRRRSCWRTPSERSSAARRRRSWERRWKNAAIPTLSTSPSAGSLT